MFEEKDLKKLKYFLDLFNHLFTYIIYSGSEIAHRMPSDVINKLDFITEASCYDGF